jgi:hypothetical protein
MYRILGYTTSLCRCNTGNCLYNKSPTYAVNCFLTVPCKLKTVQVKKILKYDIFFTYTFVSVDSKNYKMKSEAMKILWNAI